MENFVGRAERMTSELKRHDPKLFCGKSREGTLCVYRMSHRFESYMLGDNVLTNVRPAPHFIFALTENWKANGKAVDWGIDPVLERIKSMDLWNRDVAGDLIKEADKDAKSKERALDNKTEDFVREFRDGFKETFKDVNTANMKKIDKRRLRDGNCK